MARRAAIGLQDFEKIIKNECFYVDKTLFIKEWWENMDDVTLITRPRRFGKTLTLSMVKYFFSISNTSYRALFESLKIWQEEKYHVIQGAYPVIFFSFSRVKGRSYQTARELICQILSDLYAEHRFLLEGDLLTKHEKRYFNEVSDKMEDSVAAVALHRMSLFLYKYYKKKVIILLDEYDTPMLEAYLHGYWEDMSEYIRALLNASFKDNPYMERGILTGITRVGKESIFSDLNNLEVVTTTSRKYETAFGFTEEEVFEALREFGLSDRKQDVKRWYDGFCFGSQECIYNPWSVLNFLDKGRFCAYWIHTSANSLVGKLVLDSNSDMKLAMEDLLVGRSIRTQIDEEIVFSQLDKKKTAVWSLLLAGGYLKVLRTEQNRRGKMEYHLTLTNKEIRMMFDEMFLDWFSNKRVEYHQFSDALLSADLQYMNEYINEIAKETFSSFDTGEKLSEFKQPENCYHGKMKI